ncbi:MAG: hypothetical protein ACAI44_25280 [Candidatus Sericytochromatia bacterium]
MNSRLLLALTLSLTLAACSTQLPLHQGAPAKPPRTAAVAKQGDKVKIKLRLDQGFGTQSVSLSTLAFVQVEVNGLDFEEPVPHEGPEFIPVNGTTIEATVPDIPSEAGAVRIVTLRGFDAGQDEIEAFELAAIYVSDGSKTTISPVLSRRDTVLGRVLNRMLVVDPLEIENFDVDGLRASLDQASGYDPASRTVFTRDPSRFNHLAIYELIRDNQFTVPTAAALNASVETGQDDLSLTLRTPNNARIDEAVTLVVNDPTSRSVQIHANSHGGLNTEIEGITGTGGNWVLRALGADGRELTRTTVTFDEGGVRVGQNPLILTGVEEAPEQFRINSFTAEDQEKPAVAMDASGDMLVVWESYYQDADQEGIFGQRYDSQGLPVGAEIKVNTSETGDQVAPDVAMNPSGRSVVVWQGPDADGTGIYAQVYDSSGNTVGGEIAVNNNAVFSQFQPAVAIDDDGDFVVAWTGSVTGSDNDLGIFARRFDSTGAPLAVQFRVNTDTVNAQTTPAVAMNGAGRFAVTWQSNDAFPPGQIRYRVFDASGTAVAAEATAAAGVTYQEPDIAMDDDGDFVIAWTTSATYLGPIEARRFLSDGTPDDVAFVVAELEGANDVFNPRVGMDSDGDFVVSWDYFYYETSVYSVLGRRYDNNSDPVGEAFTISTNSEFDNRQSDIDMNGSGRFTSVFSTLNGLDGDQSGVFGIRYGSDGKGLIPGE